MKQCSLSKTPVTSAHAPTSDQDTFFFERVVGPHEVGASEAWEPNLLGKDFNMELGMLEFVGFFGPFCGPKADLASDANVWVDI